jgi:hypothetical protein
MGRKTKDERRRRERRKKITGALRGDDERAGCLRGGGREQGQHSSTIERSQRNSPLGWMVTRLAWMAAKLVSSKSETRYASAASWSAMTADDWKRRSVLKSWAISRTRRWKLRVRERERLVRSRERNKASGRRTHGSLRIRSSVDFW